MLNPHHPPGHLNYVADHLPRRGPILKTEYSLHVLGHIRQEFACLGQAICGPCHLSKQHKTGKFRRRLFFSTVGTIYHMLFT